MWVLKLETSHEGTFVTALAKKYGLSFYGYPLKYYKKGDYLIVQASAFIDLPKEKINFLKVKMKEEKTIEKIYFNKGFVIVNFKMPLWLSALYSTEIIFIKPQVYTSDGREIMEVASWTKKPLMDLVKVYKKEYKTKILKFRKKDISNISLTGLHPELTEKQKLALKLAVNNEYYEFPKKITLKKLAKLMKVSFSTYQAHLSKAESKFIPGMFKKIF